MAEALRCCELHLSFSLALLLPQPPERHFKKKLQVNTHAEDSQLDIKGLLNDAGFAIRLGCKVSLCPLVNFLR